MSLDSRRVAASETNSDPEGVSAVAPLAQSTGGSSGSFRVLADDERRYWCKTLNNCRHERVPINE